MNVALWIAQALLALMFLMAGVMKLSKAKSELRDKLGDWVDQFKLSSLRLIGLLELLGAIGISLPLAFNTYSLLTPLAAIGLALTMVGAVKIHLQRKESSKMATNVVLMLLAVFVAVGRWYLVVGV